mgnify:CR=1 FL=1
METHIGDEFILNYPCRPDDVNNSIIKEKLRNAMSHLNEAAILIEKNSSVDYICSSIVSISSNRERCLLGIPKGGVIRVNSNRNFVFPELRPNTCGILLAEIKGKIDPKTVVERIRENKNIFSSEQWDYGKDNHFVSLLQASNGNKFALVHGSTQSVKHDKNKRMGLYPEHSRLMQESLVSIETSKGKVDVLLDDSAVAYWESYSQAEKESKISRRMIARFIFGEIETVSDQIHVGMQDLKTYNIGVNVSDNTDSIYPLLTKKDHPIYMVSPNKHSIFSGISLQPHSYAKILSDFSHIQRVVKDARGCLFELVNEDGIITIARDFKELAFESNFCVEKPFQLPIELDYLETLSPILCVKL